MTDARPMACWCVDCETTGFNEPQVLEFARAEVIARPGPTFTMGPATVERYKPSKPIQLGAMATHHIIPADLEECPPTPEKFELPRFIIAHNVDFDWNALGAPEDVKRIDSMWLARMAWPDLDSHSLGALTYHLHPPAEARELLKNAHSAEADIKLCFHVFCCALLSMPMDAPPASWGDIWRLSEAARVPKKLDFGKHKGTPIAEVPRDYVDWYARQEDKDPYLMMAFRQAGLLAA